MVLFIFFYTSHTYLMGDLMKTIKKISNCFLFHSITIIIIYSFLTLLYYFNIIDFSLFSILKLLTIMFSFLIFGFILGKESTKKRYLLGIKYSSIWICFLFLTVIFLHKFQFKTIIFYFIILFCSILGSVFGINKKKI